MHLETSSGGLPMSEGLPRTIDWMRETYGEHRPNYIGVDELERFL